MRIAATRNDVADGLLIFEQFLLCRVVVMILKQ